jgi:hypothetical protein
LREAFLRFVPHAEVKQLAIWPTRLEDEECGRDLSRRAIKFIQKHSAEADARTD